MTHEEIMAQSNANIQRTMDSFSKRNADRKRGYEIEDLQAELNHTNKMWGDHDEEMARMKSASEQRINDYRTQAYQGVDDARAVEPEYESVDEPEQDDDMTSELLNRMDANEAE